MCGEEKLQRDLHVRGATNRCPYCKDVISDLKEVVACAPCGARHHEECYQSHGACASCSSTDVLVARSKARARRERPPKGSVIEVEELQDGGTRYTWPSFGGQALAFFLIIFISCIVTIPLLIWPLWKYMRRNSRRSSLTLRDDELEIEIHGMMGTKHEKASRDDVGAVRLARVAQQGFMRVSVDVGVDRIPIGAVGGFPVLKEPELEWLHEVMQEWKEVG